MHLRHTNVTAVSNGTLSVDNVSVWSNVSKLVTLRNLMWGTGTSVCCATVVMFFSGTLRSEMIEQM